MSNTETSTPAPLPTQAYFDPEAGHFAIITAKNFTLRESEIPADVLTATRERQETWCRTQIRKCGLRPTGKAQPYPWGFLYNTSN